MCKYVTLQKLIVLDYVMSNYVGLVAGKKGISQLNSDDSQVQNGHYPI